MKKIDLSGKTAFVTGGGVGIGAGIAHALAESGAKVAITYYSHRENAEKTADEIKQKGGEAVIFKLDASNSDEVNKVVPEVAKALGGKIDILVNNAGHLIGRVDVSEMSDEHWHKVIDTNLSSAFYVTRAVLPFMPEGGRIVNMASLAARNGGGNGAVAYAASKAGILGFTRGLSKELAPRKITVNALAPGFIVNTPFHETFTGQDKYDGIIQRIPLQRAGTPADVAGAVLYFVSDLGAWVTGQVAEINGGSWFI
ncbi:3-oxoacyl-ACP reductase FabG [Spirochaetia bacterium 38H-sp]|uniref:3-oxoacyl-ACP reductase FabG n=1 Tax=Rarispira pelagica TaxID=3141764 RepID=A0ABU9UC86_9SPIR